MDIGGKVTEENPAVTGRAKLDFFLDSNGFKIGKADKDTKKETKKSHAAEGLILWGKVKVTGDANLSGDFDNIIASVIKGERPRLQGGLSGTMMMVREGTFVYPDGFTPYRCFGKCTAVLPPKAVQKHYLDNKCAKESSWHGAGFLFRAKMSFTNEGAMKLDSKGITGKFLLSFEATAAGVGRAPGLGLVRLGEIQLVGDKSSAEVFKDEETGREYLALEGNLYASVIGIGTEIKQKVVMPIVY